MSATTEEQISVFLKNRSGILADLCATLSDRDVNIRAMTVLESFDIGTIRMIVDNVALAEESLTEFAAAWIVVNVLAVDIPNQSGGLARIAGAFGQAGVNIEYMYATVMPDMEHTVGIFRVADDEIERALAIKFEE